MLIVAIDPGLSGAIGFLRNGVYVAVEDMPTVVKGVGSVKREVSPAGLKQLIRKHLVEGEEVVAVLEKIGPMPAQGVSSVFSLGDSFGCARSILVSFDFELHQVTPQVWKKSYNLSSDKEQARALASRLFPTAPLYLKKHDGRAEAILIAKYLYESKFKR